MAWHPMTPETIARRAAERAKEKKNSKQDLINRLREMTAKHGPGSIWAEMLAEHDSAGNPARGK